MITDVYVETKMSVIYPRAIMKSSCDFVNNLGHIQKNNMFFVICNYYILVKTY